MSLGRPLLLTPSLEDYLKTIMLLEQEKGSARPIDIAKAMRVGKASTSLALRRLKQKGLIAHDAYGEASLTPEGKKTAKRILLRHNALSEFFVDILGIPKDQAEANAHRLEHAIDEAVLSRLTVLMRLFNQDLKRAMAAEGGNKDLSRKRLDPLPQEPSRIPNDQADRS